MTTTKKRVSLPTIGKMCRKVGLLLTGISGALLTAAATLPPVMTTIATYLSVLGSLSVAIGQALTDDEKKENQTQPFCKLPSPASNPSLQNELSLQDQKNGYM